MISASTEYLAKVNNGDIPLVRMQLTTSGGTSYWLEDGQFWSDSFSFSEATSQDGAFEVGSAIIGGFHFALNNFGGSFDGIDFSGAVVIPFVYYTINGTNEYLPKGVFYINSHTTSGYIIRITAMDALKLMDNTQTTITYPITVQSLVETLCTANGITLATQTIPNGSFSLSQPTDSSGTAMKLTDRQMLSYACQCIGCFAKMNEYGYLEIKWYDFANPISITSTFNGKTLWTDAIEVTGVGIEIPNGTDTTTTIYGTDDRNVYVKDNPFVTSANAPTIYANISANIFGISFRPGTLPVLANPCLQAGDVLEVTDHITNTTYLIPITSTTYTKNLTQNIVCSFEDKDDADLRPSASYNTKVSVENAIAAAQAADALAQAAQEMAETSGYQPYIVSDKGTAFMVDTTATLTAVIYDRDMNEVDPDGTDVIYRWWITKDGTRASYLNGGKEIEIPVSDTLCDYAAGIYFETKDITEGVNPFLLAKRDDATILCKRDGTPLSARAADGVVTT